MFGVCLASCSTTEKTIVRGSTVYKADNGNDPANPTPRYRAYQVIRHKNVKLTDNGNYLIIDDNPNMDLQTYRPITTDWVAFNSNSIFSVPFWKTADTSVAYFFEKQDDHRKSCFWYGDGKVVLQGASIAFKIRPKITRPGLLDSIPSTTETGFTVGFLTGYKFSLNKFRKTQNVFGNQVAKYSITPGVILATGAADLSAAATRPAIQFPRKAAMITCGGSVVFGINSLNIGYAFGFDYATGPHASSWLYQGKMWNGIIVSLDLIK